MLGKKIAIIELQQETNSFSPVFTTLNDFESSALYYGEELLTKGRGHKLQIHGFLNAVEKYGLNLVEPVPILSAWAISGGPVQWKVYQFFKEYILMELKKHPDIAGVYLSMHGAMGVEGLRDPESDLLRAIRRLVGEHIPIGVSLDLHANITKELVQLSTFITSYRTNPHRDHAKVGFKTGKLLIDTVLGKIEPVMAYRKMRMLKGGGYTIDFLSPMRRIFSKMKDMEKTTGVLSVSNFMVHVWLDDPELGWSTIVVTDKKKDLAEKLAEELAELNWSVKDVKHPEPSTPQKAIDIARKSWLRRLFGTTVFCDVSDIVAAGAPGENTWLLKEIMQQASDLVSYVPLRDASAATTVFEKHPGDTVEIIVGGKLDKVYNTPVIFSGKIVSTHLLPDTGKTIVLKNKGIHLILTERPAAVFNPKFYKKLGLSLWRADISVVKNLFPFRYFFMLYNRKTINVVSSGTTNINVFDLKYKFIPRPIYPLDPISTWK